TGTRRWSLPVHASTDCRWVTAAGSSSPSPFPISSLRGPTRRSSSLSRLGSVTTCDLERARKDQHRAVPAREPRNRIRRIRRADSHPAQLDAELVEVDGNANAGIEYVTLGPVVVDAFVIVVVPQDAAVSKETNTIDQRLRSVDFSVDHGRRLSKVARSKIEPRADILGGDAYVQSGVTRS